MAARIAVTSKRAWHAYERCLRERPIVTKSLTNAPIYMFGDLLVQGMEWRLNRRASCTSSGDEVQPYKYDFARTLRMGAFASLFAAPFLHNWFRIVDGLLPKNLLYLPPKIVLDQTIGAGVNLGAFWAIQSTLKGHSISETVETVKKRLYPTLLACWKLWPWVNMVNFTLVPLERRVLVVAVVNIPWSAYLSYMQSKTTRTVPNHVAEDKRELVA